MKIAPLPGQTSLDFDQPTPADEVVWQIIKSRGLGQSNAIFSKEIIREAAKQYGLQLSQRTVAAMVQSLILDRGKLIESDTVHGYWIPSDDEAASDPADDNLLKRIAMLAKRYKQKRKLRDEEFLSELSLELERKSHRE